jgi:hypothetical protein
MTRDIPTPLRAAAGLAAVAVDEARRLPSRLASLPVVALGAALQASMRVQQRYAELIGRGDQVLSGVRDGDEQPPWAQFDEDVASPNGSTSAYRHDDEGWAFAAEEAVEPEPVDEPVNEPVDEAPALPLEGYDKLSLPQLRARLVRLSADDLGVLLDHERRHAARPPYLTMLENRLGRVRKS